MKRKLQIFTIVFSSIIILLEIFEIFFQAEYISQIAKAENKDMNSTYFYPGKFFGFIFLDDHYCGILNLKNKNYRYKILDNKSYAISPSNEKLKILTKYNFPYHSCIYMIDKNGKMVDNIEIGSWKFLFVYKGIDENTTQKIEFNFDMKKGYLYIPALDGPRD